MEENKALDSVHIGFFGSDTIGHYPDASLELLKQFGKGANKLRLLAPFARWLPLNFYVRFQG